MRVWDACVAWWGSVIRGRDAMLRFFDSEKSLMVFGKDNLFRVLCARVVNTKYVVRPLAACCVGLVPE
jgi:hypothetical protein